MRNAADSVAPGSWILDAGAGDARYRALFDRHHYETADFGMVDKAYGELDYQCELASIPVEDARFDLVIFTQVMEHLEDPLSVLVELRRVLKPDGRIWATAPLFFEEHEQPYDFYRYTQFAWRSLGERAGLEVEELRWLEGYDGTLAYQLGFAARSLPNSQLPIRWLFGALAWYFYRRDVRGPDRARGLCKNYACIYRRPAE
jgi:ubiquinone/menaquinone biosynthesis C-methylase UbiE